MGCISIVIYGPTRLGIYEDQPIYSAKEYIISFKNNDGHIIHCILNLIIQNYTIIPTMYEM